MAISVSLDPTDFPLISVTGSKLEVQLLPVTKVQLEYMLGDVRRFDQAAYAAMTNVNPRASWRTATGRPVTVFATGILPHEAESFSHWLGAGFRLPTDAEWRTIDKALAASADPQTLQALATSSDTHPAARALLAGPANSPSRRWREIGLLESGLLEWVRCQTGFGLQGRPHPELYRMIHNPEVHEAVRVNQTPIPRHRAFGFRLVRSLTVGGGA